MLLYLYIVHWVEFYIQGEYWKYEFVDILPPYATASESQVQGLFCGSAF